MREYETFVSHLECSATGQRHAADRLHGLSEAGKPLLVRYDLDAIRRAVSREAFAARGGGFWKYREFLPVRNNASARPRRRSSRCPRPRRARAPWRRS
jgi:threonine synthase